MATLREFTRDERGVAPVLAITTLTDTNFEMKLGRHSTQR